uniref:Magnesium-dependent phosphatase-1 n=1 Tax=Amphora coffeiformis TaxID=265554 RepID=A0A7S3L5V5_9STRA|eukprot:scaffold1060_cov196-Amphora_coffeaeformis.AAC.20
MKLAVFDLDYTVWKPEMYQLARTPKLVEASSKPRLGAKIIHEAQTTTKGMILMSGGEPIRMFKGANVALTEINLMQGEGMDISAAVASKTDEPEWARMCMEHMALDDGTSLASCFEDRIEISYGSKVGHITRLHKKTGIPFSEMAFFDNEYGNIRSVSKALPDVRCYYTPDGMTREAWEKAKTDFGI